MMAQDTKGPAVEFPPPMVFILLMAAGYLMSLIVPVAISDDPVVKALGVASAVFGLAVILSAVVAFRRARTSLKPWKPAAKIVQTGLYAWSRHPIYIAFCFITVGIGLFFNIFWIAISFIPSLIIVYFSAIRKEEAYLESKFGEEYRAYKAKVRRWL